ncbi:MAG: hypothetical protein WGN25_13775 [Candidatus Electrothrix sp. GW3-4]|uniref:nSTAND1 domain-containing NTPase n=1 Tax=Candidatus Electrothrix sp. GW3-4 TaxID=3126740 RepID=UPI0030D0A7EA
MINTDNPYIGPRSFTRQEADRFFGREAEAADLLSLVIAERLVLFYAQSGAGKTSLINTSLIPGLEENGRAVLPVGRVGGELPVDIAEADNIFAFSLMSQLDQGGTDPALLARLELSAFLRDLVSSDGQTYRYELPDKNEPIPDNPEDGPICVLIIDQFEEILTAHPDRWQDRAGFFRQLNRAMQDDPRLSVVLSLREDYVAALEPYAPLLTDRMRARFYMERMGRGAALAAVKRPAEKASRPFAPGAAETLVDNLSLIRSARSSEPRPGQYIEPVQLQVVCFQLWRNLPSGEEITTEQVSRIGNIDHALADFYEQAMAETLLTSGGSELELRQWFERRLITEAGTRGTVFQGETHSGGMENQVVRLLEDRFLVRAESRSGAVWYELVHDRFVEPILQANQKWMETQGPLLRDALAWLDTNKTNRSLLYTGEKLAKTLAEVDGQTVPDPVVADFLQDCKGRQAWLDEKAAANRRFRRWFKVAVVVAVVAVLTSLWAWQATNKAKIAEQQALTSQEKTEKTLSRLQQTEALNTGMALNAKAEAAENKGSRLYAHLYSLHALTKLLPKNEPYYQEALVRAQANPVPLPAFIGHHDDRVNSVAFSPDGRFFADSYDKNIVIWDTITGERLHTLAGHADEVNSVAFSPDGLLLASGSNDKSIGIWDIHTGNRLKVLEGHTDSIGSISFSPDGRLLASCSKDKTIGIWDVQTGKRLHTLAGQSQVTRVAFSPDGRTIASTFYDGTIGIRDVHTGKRLQTLDGYTSVLLSIAFSHDGRTLAAGSFGTIDLWDITIGKRLRTIKRDGTWMITSVSFSPDGRAVASGSFGNIITVWDVQTGQSLQTLQGTASGRSIAFSPDGQTLVSSGSWNNTAGLWEINPGRLRDLKGHAGRVTNIWFSPDSRAIASVAKDKTLGTWDVATGRRLQKIPLREMTGMDYVLFSPDGRMFAAGSYGSNSIRLGEVSTGKWLRNLEGHTKEIDNFAFSSDNRFLASAASDKTIKIWDVQTGVCLRTLPVEDEVETSISFSPNGRLFAAGLKNKTINLWDNTTGKRLQTLKGVSGVSTFSSDSRLLAVSDSTDHTISIWDISTGQRVQTLKRHKAWVDHLVFSSDNLLLASSSMDKTIAIWDVKTGKRVRTLKENIASEGSIAFSPDNRFLAFTTDDNTVVLWDLEPAINEFSGISLDENGEYKIDLDTLPYKLEGLELKPIEQQQNTPDKPARWSRYHPFHWLPAAEKGDSNAMLQIGIIYDRNNDIARALPWYGKAIKAGNEQAQKQQDILLHWLEDKENWQTVPGPFRTTFCKAKVAFELPEKVADLCEEQ